MTDILIQVIKETNLTEEDNTSKSDKDYAPVSHGIEENENFEENRYSDQVPTLAILEKSSLNDGSGRLSANSDVAASSSIDFHEQPHSANPVEVVDIGKAGHPESGRNPVIRSNGEKVAGFDTEGKLLGPGEKNQDNFMQKVESFF